MARERLRLSSGLHSLDYKINWGFTPGLLEVVGHGASGKTSLAYAIARQADKEGYVATLIQTKSHAYPSYVMGAGPPDLVYVNPASGEAAIEAAYVAVVAGCKVVLLDALPATLPNSILRGTLSERQTSAQYKMLFHGLTAIKRAAQSRGSLIVIINELRWKGQGGGVDSYMQEGVMDIADHRIKLIRDGYVTSYGRLKEVDIIVQVTQMRGALCKIETTAKIIPKFGFDSGRNLVQALQEVGATRRRGAYWITNEGDKLGPGYVEAADEARFNEDYYRVILEETCQRS